MLKLIIESALRFKGLVVVVAVLVMGYGGFLARQTTLDVFPDFVPPQVTIQVEAPGLSANEVESLVTFPVEAAIGGITGLETTRSESIQGLAVIDVEFAEGTDIHAGRQQLTERLTEIAGALPDQVRAPTMSPLVSSTLDLLKIGLVSDKLSERELRTLADWTVRPLLKSVGGVAEVNVVGGEVEELQIIPEPDKMTALGITHSELLGAAGSISGVRGAGYLETQNQRVILHARSPEITPESVAQTIVKGSGADAILLGDLAMIQFGGMPKFGDALINGKRGVMLAMTSQRGANTLRTTEAVEEALASLEPVFEAKGVELFGRLHRPANFIEIALHHLSDSLLLGGALVAVVLLIFLASLRTALISFVSIPLSLLATIMVLHFAGITLDTMTLGGLAVAVGVVVDDAIIDVENILRRLRENRGLATPRSVVSVILDASMEVRGSVIYATLVVVAVFLPVFAMSGLQGNFFAPLAVSFILAVIVSLVVAMTVTPALCLLFLKNSEPAKDPFYLRWMKDLHRVVLSRICRVPILAMLVGVAVIVFAGMRVEKMETELLPPFREGHFVAQAFGVAGSSLGETMRFGKDVSERLLAIPEVATVEMQAGRSEKGVDTWGPERCEFHIDLKANPEREEAVIQNEIREIMESYPNMETETLTFLGDRISESLSGETASVVVSLFGNDLEVLDTAANRVSELAGGLDGAIDVRAAGISRTPGIEVTLRPESLRAAGLQPLAVLDIIQAAFQGSEVTQYYDASRVIPVMVRLDENERSDIASVRALILKTSAGAPVALESLADIKLTDERAAISHQTGRRRQVVTANVSGRSVSSYVDELSSKINATLPDGVYATFEGAAAAEAETHRELLLATSMALVGVVIFLGMVFRRVVDLILVVTMLPFAVAGGVFAVELTGLPLSLGVLVGFMTLLGLSLRNAIMLMSHYAHLVTEEGHTWSLATVIHGARERVVPVVVTTAVTGFALLPLALSPTTAGREVEGPMAVVIVGGLISSTLASLLLLPALANRFSKFTKD